MRAGATVLGVAALALVAIGYTGARLAVGDSVAVLRVPLALSVVVLMLFARPRWLGLVGAALGLAALVGPVLGMLAPSGTPGPLTLYQKNVFYISDGYDGMIGDILDKAPDVVTLQEVTEADYPVLQGIAEAYPYQQWCPFAKKGGTAVASRWPPVPGTARCLNAMAASTMQVDAPGGPVWVVSVHLRWPYPAEQFLQVRRLVPELRQLDGPIVVGGDFNMLPWGASVRAIAAATRTSKLMPYRPTYWVFGAIPLGIDHVMAGGGGSVEILPKFESDHNGVLARVDPGFGYGK